MYQFLGWKEAKYRTVMSRLQKDGCRQAVVVARMMPWTWYESHTLEECIRELKDHWIELMASNN